MPVISTVAWCASSTTGTFPLIRIRSRFLAAWDYELRRCPLLRYATYSWQTSKHWVPYIYYFFLWRISRGVEVAVQSGYYNSICTVISVLQQQKQGVLEGLSTWSQRNIPADAFGWSKYKASVSLFIQRKQKERKKKGHYHLVFRAWSNSAATTS